MEEYYSLGHSFWIEKKGDSEGRVTFENYCPIIINQGESYMSGGLVALKVNMGLRRLRKLLDIWNEDIFLHVIIAFVFVHKIPDFGHVWSKQLASYVCQSLVRLKQKEAIFHSNTSIELFFVLFEQVFQKSKCLCPENNQML